MRVSAIAAVGEDLVIGTDSGLPWRLPADLRRFKRLTLGKPVVLGRKTLELIGKPLVERPNIVLTRSASFAMPGAHIAHTPEEALQTAAGLGGEEVMVAGGGEVYRALLPQTTRLYLTVVPGRFAGNAFFPAGLPGRWRITSTEHFPADEKNAHPHTFHVLDRDPDSSPGEATPLLPLLAIH